MHNEIKIFDNFYWIGSNDRRIELFENAYPVPYGISYNSFLWRNEKNVVVDGVDSSVVGIYLENIKHILNGENVDYLIVNHMEPDHCSGFLELAKIYPEMKFIGNVKTFKLMQQFYPNIASDRFITVKEGEEFCVGSLTFKFFMAPMVHWPEVMVTYEVSTKTLFSADAFGTFGALNGNLYFDDIVDKEDYFNEARRYYTNIVGKYGLQTLALIKKASTLDIKLICPLHGPLWKNNFEKIIAKYVKWASYEAEEKSVTIVYGSIYGNTQLIADKLAQILSEKGVRHIKVFDVSKTHYSYILSDCFRTSTMIFLSATYNNGLFASMEAFLHELTSHNLSNKNVAIIENGSWAPQAGKVIRGIVSELKNMNFIDPTITVLSSATEENIAQIEELAQNIVENL